MTTERYDIIDDTVLKHYTRRFHVLDLGGGISPDISRRIAAEHDAVVTIAEKDYAGEPFDDRVMVLTRPLTVPMVQGLAKSEHFDVVLALNFVHWFGTEWGEMLDAVLQLGDHVFVQVPTEADEKAPGAEFASERVKYLEGVTKQHWDTVQFPQHPPRPMFYYCLGKYRRLTRTGPNADEGSANTYMFTSFDKLVANTRKGNKPWFLGLNLNVFCHWGGKWPTKDKVLDMLHHFRLPKENHGDIAPHNFILDGQQLYLIDGFEGWEFADEVCLANTINKVEGIL